MIVPKSEQYDDSASFLAGVVVLCRWSRMRDEGEKGKGSKDVDQEAKTRENHDRESKKPRDQRRGGDRGTKIRGDETKMRKKRARRGAR